VYISLGSNLGDREKNMASAVHALDQLPQTRVVSVSRWYETLPLGNVDQPLFLNAAAVLETALDPQTLLRFAKDIEERLGRLPDSHWQPRPIDIDIVLWEGVVMASPELTIPHPAYRHRAFVLVPLAEIAADIRDPITDRTVGELAASPAAEGLVHLYSRRPR